MLETNSFGFVFTNKLVQLAALTEQQLVKLLASPDNMCGHLYSAIKRSSLLRFDSLSVHFLSSANSLLPPGEYSLANFAILLPSIRPECACYSIKEINFWYHIRQCASPHIITSRHEHHATSGQFSFVPFHYLLIRGLFNDAATI